MEQLIPTIGRALERCIIAIGAIITIYLGYRLFVLGAKATRSELSVKARFVDFVLKGSAPGLFFMAFGSLVLLVSLYTGKVTTESDWRTGVRVTKPSKQELSPETFDKTIEEFRETKKLKTQSSDIRWFFWVFQGLFDIMVLSIVTLGLRTFRRRLGGSIKHIASTLDGVRDTLLRTGEGVELLKGDVNGLSENFTRLRESVALLQGEREKDTDKT